MRLRFDFSECTKIEIILVALIILFTVFGNNTAVSLCFALSFIVLLVYIVKRATIKAFQIYPLLLIAVAVMNVFINGLLSSDANMGFDYFKKVIMFSAFVLMLYFSAEDSVSAQTITIVKKIPVVCALVLVFSFFLFGNTQRYAGGVTLGFSNPNFTGMWLLHLTIYTFLFAIDARKHHIMRIFSSFLLISLIWLMFQTKARSCLIGLVFFVCICLNGKIFGKYVAKKPVFIALIVAAPILFVIAYRYLLNAQWFQRGFSLFVSAGKSLDSRLAVWNPATESLKRNFIFGDYSGISHGTGVSQLHNTHLDVICSYGIFPFILFIYLINSVCRKVSNCSMTYSNYCALCGFMSVIVMGSFEAAVVSGAMGMNILTVGLMILTAAKEG